MIKPSARPATGCSVGTKTQKTNPNCTFRAAHQFRHVETPTLLTWGYAEYETHGQACRRVPRGRGVSAGVHGEQVPEAPACRGEAVAPAPVGVPKGQGVSRRRSANPAFDRRVTRGPFPAPSGGLKKYDLHAIALGVAFKSFYAPNSLLNSWGCRPNYYFFRVNYYFFRVNYSLC